METLTLEELQARLATSEADKKAAQELASKLEADLKKSQSEKKKLEKTSVKELAKEELPSFTIEEDDEDNDIEAGDYVFNSPTITWDDNSVINIKELAASKDAKDKSLYEEICAKLVMRKSGIIDRKEV